MPEPKRDDETMEGYVIRLIRDEERDRCAKIAVSYARAISKGTYPRAGSVEEIGRRIAAEIRNPEALVEGSDGTL